MHLMHLMKLIISIS